MPETMGIQSSKGLKIPGPKVSPTTPDEAQFARITPFLRSGDYKPEDFYIGQLRMAHNAIDRDGERFSEKLLERFAETAVRKTMLLDHDTWESGRSAIGKFFDVEMEKVPVSGFRTLREDDDFLWLVDPEGFYELKVPRDLKEVWFLSPWFYVPRAAVDPKEITKIDTGIYDWASIGFTAERREPVEGPDGEVLYSEYAGGPRAEMREGSLVYLGAQQGAAVKSADGGGQSSLFREENPKKEEKRKMEEFLKKLAKALGVPVSGEDDALEAVRSLKKDSDAAAKRLKEAEDTSADVKALTEERDGLKEKLDGLEPLLKEHKGAEIALLAAEGKAYRDDLVARYAQAKVKLGEAEETPTATEDMKKVAGGFELAFLKSEVSHLERRVEEKFPAERQTEGEDRGQKAAHTTEKKEPGSSLDYDEGKEG